MKTFNSENTREAHFAKAQYYRLYQLYERGMNDERITNQLNLLNTDFNLKSEAGVTNGHYDYRSKLKVYEGWQNAHHVQNVQFEKNTQGQGQIVADIRYQNIQPNGEKVGYAIDYIVDFEEGNQALKKISSIELKATEAISDVFEDSYA